VYRAKTIDELYEEVKDYDIVLTNDAPLETALNSRISTPRVGTFAVTPRHLASRVFAAKVLDGPLWGDLRIISEISRETGYDIKYVHGELENIRRIRKHTASVEKYLYSRSSRAVYASFRAMPTLEKVMEMLDQDSPVLEAFYKGKRTAMIGVELFDDLDKHMYLDDAEEIDVFDYKHEVGFDIVYEAGNDRQVAENAVSLIDPVHATDTAIVLDVNGPITDAVRAALYRRNMPFKNNMTVKDLSQIRDYLELLNGAMEYDTIRVKHIRPLLSAYGGDIKAKYSEYLVSRYAESLEPENVTGKILSTMRGIREMTFDEVCEAVVNKKYQPQVRMLINDMRIADEKVTAKLVNEITYAVNNVKDLKHNEQIPESEKHGVLIADCNNATYIDRPLVIYLGMGPEWVRDIIGKDYIDREDQAERDAQTFSILMQQGSHRIYIANSMKDGKNVRPCITFDRVLDRKKAEENMECGKDIESFGEVFAEVVRGPWYEPAPADPVRHGTSSMSDPEWDGQFSKSSLNRYMQCPRQYMFGEVVPSADKEHTVLGNLIHDFAEFYLCYPEHVKEKGIGYYVQAIAEKSAGLVREETREVEVSKIDLSLRNIVRFLDGLDPFDDVELDIDIGRREEWKRNVFVLEAGYDKVCGMSEIERHSKNVPLHGIFDLLCDGVVYDYKTGTEKSIGDIAKNMVEPNSYGTLETQPLVYLSLLRDCVPESKNEFRLFFTTDNDLEEARGPVDLRMNQRIVVLSGEDKASLMSGYLLENFDTVRKYGSLISGWNTFVDLLKDSGVENAGRWPDDDQLVSAVAGRFNMKREDALAAVKKASKLMVKDFFVTGGKAIVPVDVLDSFDDDVRRCRTEAAGYYGSSFPFRPIGECAKCEYFSLCTGDVFGEEEEGSDE
jgi:hypothetical protein